MAEAFMITESSWLYPVYDAMAAMALIPEEKKKGYNLLGILGNVWKTVLIKQLDNLHIVDQLKGYREKNLN